MYKYIPIITILFLCSCKTTRYFVVRHAERAESSVMSGDVPLSDAGKQRAEELKNALASEKISHIFSTNYSRTKSTVQPLADAIAVPVQVYDPRDSTFMGRLKTVKGNILIVGHSNTVDDLVNGLSGRKELPGDLNDSQYGDLFVVKKKGKGFKVERGRFGN